MHQRKLIALSAAIIFLAGVTTLQARVFTDAASRVKVNTPRGWKAKASGTDLEVSSPDDLVNILFHVSSEGKMDKALDEAEKELRKNLKNIKAGKEQTGTHRGMPYVELEGSGTIEGVRVTWGVTVLMAKKPVIIMYIFLPGWKKHGRAVAKFAQSVQRY